MSRLTRLPPSQADIPATAAEQGPDGAAQPTVDRGADVALSDANVGSGPKDGVTAEMSVPPPLHTPDTTVSGMGRLANGAAHFLRSVVDGEYRRANARDAETAMLQGNGTADDKMAAALALRPLLKSEEIGSSKPSVVRAVTELKLLVADREADWLVRSSALLALNDHYSVDGEPAPTFAREVARSLAAESNPGMRLGFIQALSDSRDPLVREVLLEHVKNRDPLIATAAGEALKNSYSLLYSSDLERTLLAMVRGDDGETALERTVALDVLAARKHQSHLSPVANIIKDPGEPAELRAKALEHYGQSANGEVRGALMALAGQDKSSWNFPSLLDRARQLLAATEPKLEIVTEEKRRVSMTHYAA